MNGKDLKLLFFDEDSSQELARVLSNQKARQILGLLSKEGKLSETDISKKLKIPISTVHYNIRQLLKAEIITGDEYSYSKKGREITHYALANKYIIIAPSSSKNQLIEKVKTLVASFMVGAFASIALYFQQRKTADALPGMGMLERSSVMSTAQDTAQNVATKTMEVSSQGFQLPFHNNISFYFFLGVCMTIGVFLIIEMVKYFKRSKRRPNKNPKKSRKKR